MNNLHVKTAFQLPEDITDSDTETAAALIAPPNITMRIADQDGNNINTAKVSGRPRIPTICFTNRFRKVGLE